jgi:hypothetical protein
MNQKLNLSLKLQDWEVGPEVSGRENGVLGPQAQTPGIPEMSGLAMCPYVPNKESVMAEVREGLLHSTGSLGES